MNDLSLKAIIQNAEARPEEDRQELADYARVIEARRQGSYRLDDAERGSIREGLDDAEGGRFASDTRFAESGRRFGA